MMGLAYGWVNIGIQTILILWRLHETIEIKCDLKK